MGWFNRLCIRQLRKAEKIVEERIALGVSAADTGFAEWELHAEKMRRRRRDIRARIAEREAREARS